MAKLFANSGDPDPMLHFAASDLGLHCLTITLLPVSRLQWVKRSVCISLAFTLKKIHKNKMSLTFNYKKFCTSITLLSGNLGTFFSLHRFLKL